MSSSNSTQNSSSSSTLSQKVSAPAGVIRGTDEYISGKGRIRIFKGIPFGRIQEGRGRWAAARPCPAFEKPFEATEFGPIAPQLPQNMARKGLELAQGEDCLSLNIWAPANIPAGGLPVLVWIHGGAYYFGASTQELFNGRNLASDTQAIVVTLNYRLGALGFLDFSSFGKNFDSNVALRDVMLGLEWIKKNISAFGGNDQNVTVFGESAGAGILGTLLTSQKAKGLFDKMILQSAPMLTVISKDDARGLAEQYLDYLGVKIKNATELRKLPLETLLAAADEMFLSIPEQYPGLTAYAPTIDGDIVQEHPLVVMGKKKQLAVPLIIGSNKDEATLFKMIKSNLLPTTTAGVKKLLEDLQTSQPSKKIPTYEKVQGFYPEFKKDKQALRISGDISFRAPTLWMARQHSTVAPTWLYRFDFYTRFMKLAGIGATHGSEMAYVWGNINPKFKDPWYKLGGLRAGRALSARMIKVWGAFAHQGNPGMDWTRFSLNKAQTRIFDVKDTTVSCEVSGDSKILDYMGTAPLVMDGFYTPKSVEVKKKKSARTQQQSSSQRSSKKK